MILPLDFLRRGTGTATGARFARILGGDGTRRRLDTLGVVALLGLVLTARAFVDLAAHGLTLQALFALVGLLPAVALVAFGGGVLAGFHDAADFPPYSVLREVGWLPRCWALRASTHLGRPLTLTETSELLHALYAIHRGEGPDPWELDHEAMDAVIDRAVLRARLAPDGAPPGADAA